MAEKRDYYEILGLDRNASSEDIRNAYRRLAKKYHPDVSSEPESEDRFKEINEAYAILSDDERRSTYDRYGHAGLKGIPTDFDFNISDIFEQFFDFGAFGRRDHRAPRRGADLSIDLTLEFEEAAFGIEREITFSRMEVCSVCQGSGAESGTSPVRCTYCEGTGEIRQVRQTFLGSMVNVTTCPTCGGQGETIPHPCPNCHRRGFEKREVTKVVPIPGGVNEGTRIRLAGEGEPGIHGGHRGDLYVRIHVRPHRYFRRRKDDVLLDLEINVAQATLGADIEVPTLDGNEVVTIPSGTQPGKVLRLRGKGVPRLRRNGRGDQIVIVSIAIPRTLSAEQRELFESLADSLGTEVNYRERGFIDRFKELLGGLAD